MGCNCMSTGSYSPQVQAIKRSIVPVEDCEYTEDVLNEWLDLLLCIKNNNYAPDFSTTVGNINGFIGTVKSALNYPTNPCYFKISLDSVKVLVDKIKSTDKCQN